MVDEGRIELDAPVDRHLPWFSVPCAGDVPITIGHLLTHTAGIVTGIDATPEAAFQVWALRDLPTFSAPGERFHYSNVGYKALGLVLEALERRPYREVIRARILDPLEMWATEPAITHEIRGRLAVGYGYLHDDRLGYSGATLAPATWLQTETADGSIASTAADMCAFTRLLLRAGEGPTGRLLSARAFAEMTTGRTPDDEGGAYGYGLSIHELEERRYIGHGGGMVGYLAGMEMDPEAGLGAIVLQNGVGAKPMALARMAIRTVREARDRTTAATSTPSASAGTALEIARNAGVYSPDEPGLEPIEIVVSDRLMLRVDGREIPLEELEDDLFLVPDVAFDRFPLRIERLATCSPEVWHGGRRYVRTGSVARRLPEPSAELREIAGHYRSHNPWTTTFASSCAGIERGSSFRQHPTGSGPSSRLSPRTTAHSALVSPVTRKGFASTRSPADERFAPGSRAGPTTEPSNGGFGPDLTEQRASRPRAGRHVHQPCQRKRAPARAGVRRERSHRTRAAAWPLPGARPPRPAATRWPRTRQPL